MSVKRVLGLVVAVFAMIPAGSAAADTGLIARWHMNEGSGTTVADSSGHGNNGTLIGNVKWIPGRFGTALSFDGGSARVHVGQSDSLEPTAAVSVSAWVMHAGSPGPYRYVLAKGATACIAASYALYTGRNGGLEFYVSSNRGSVYHLSADAGARVWDGNWHFVVGTYDGTRIRLFVDGREVGSGTEYAGPLQYLLPNSNDLFIGDYPGCSMRSFVGAIDEVSVWSGALTGAAVQPPGGSGPLPTKPPPPPAGGGPVGTGGGPVGTGSGQPGAGQPGEAPALTGLRVSPTAFAIDAKRHGRSHGLRTGATISYNDTQAARSTFIVQVARQGVLRGRRCLAPPRHRAGRHLRRCTRFVALGRFRHLDRAGRNAFRFPGLGRRKLAPGRYRLTATPRADGRTGAAVRISFKVVR